MMRLLQRELRTTSGSAERRRAQRDGGTSSWELRGNLLADDLRGVLDAAPEPEEAAPLEPGHGAGRGTTGEPALEDYDTPLPMTEGEDLAGASVPTRLSVLRVG